MVKSVSWFLLATLQKTVSGFIPKMEKSFVLKRKNNLAYS